MWEFGNLLSIVCILEQVKNRLASVNECDKFHDLNI